jgi:hypothetical protein
MLVHLFILNSVKLQGSAEPSFLYNRSVPVKNMLVSNSFICIGESLVGLAKQYMILMLGRKSTRMDRTLDGAWLCICTLSFMVFTARNQRPKLRITRSLRYMCESKASVHVGFEWAGPTLPAAPGLGE